MRLVGTVLSVLSLAAIASYLSYLFILSRDVPLVLKIAIPAGFAGLLLLLASVLRERLKVRKREGLDKVKP